VYRQTPFSVTQVLVGLSPEPLQAAMRRHRRSFLMGALYQVSWIYVLTRSRPVFLAR
jgi:hypothetical protein